MPRRHVAGVARLQLVVQALHQLILGSGGDYLHACLYTRILICTAREKLFFQGVYGYTACNVLWRKTVQKSYSSRVYIDIETGRIAFFSAKTVQKKLSPRRRFFFFLRSLNVSRQLVKAGRRQTPASGTGARPRARLELGQGHGVQAPREGARRVVGLRLDTEAGLRGGAAACGAARSAAAGAQREVLRLSGVVHVVGGPDVLQPGRSCAARNANGQPRRCRRANSRRAGQRSSNLADRRAVRVAQRSNARSRSVKRFGSRSVSRQSVFTCAR